MKLPTSPINEFWILRTLVIDGRVAISARRAARDVARMDPWQVRLDATLATDCAFGHVPRIALEGGSIEPALAALRRIVKADGETEVLQ